LSEAKRLLILGGTGEAVALAEKAQSQYSDRLDVIYSLAGRVKPERIIAATVRVGGFGGGNGLADFLKAEEINLVIDATHPFAVNISANAHDACLSSLTPRLMLNRPSWDMPTEAKYLEAEDMPDAARMLSGLAKRVLVTTGQSQLDALAACPETYFVIRVIEEPANPPEIKDFTFLCDRPPYSLENEIALMQEHKIDALLTKQSGGKGTVAKIVAAIKRGIPIVMLRRPLPEPGESVETVEEALRWLGNRI
jgi:precorrin-6A/cobalt-precorrin-6A reductase